MAYTPSEILRYVQEEDVKFIRLAFCDLYGRQKNIAIMPPELPRAFETGISVDASAVPGFGGRVRSDLLLFPDASTLTGLPWRPSSGRVVRMFCDIRRPDGSAFVQDSRRILRAAVQAAAKEGVCCSFGAEFEFYLFKNDENGQATHTPFDRAGYMDIYPLDKGENVRREICLYLEEMGVTTESSHHEQGPGQNEIALRCAEAMTAADQATLFKNVTETVAMQNGLTADFSPKPLPDAPGSGLHIHLSLEQADEAGTAAFMAGILEHIRELTVFLNPCEESYRRLGEDKAPRFISWSPENRSQLIRIPAAARSHRRMELRSPDAASNPYLLYALLLYAGLDGLRRHLTPPPAVEEDLSVADSQAAQSLSTLPGSLQEAKNVARQSAWLASVLEKEILDAYC